MQFPILTNGLAGSQDSLAWRGFSHSHGQLAQFSMRKSPLLEC